jgi:hypothetical protein
MIIKMTSRLGGILQGYLTMASNKILFEHDEDRKFFCKLLSSDDSGLNRYYELFDFRDPKQKRREFSLMRKVLLNILVETEGWVCKLGYVGICDESSGFSVDHIIPLSSNVLNKEIRKIQGVAGKKTPTQSFGSNSKKNLVISCNACNGHKKHRFLSTEKILELLSEKF